MKLRTKLMAAPVFASAALFLSLAGFLWVLGSYRDQAQEKHETSAMTQFAVSGIREQVSNAHMTLYKTATIISSLNDDQVKAIRANLVKDAGKVNQMLDASLGKDEQASQGIGEFKKALAVYLKSADDALDMAAMDPNTGVAALQTADGNYKQLVGQLTSLVGMVQQHVDDDMAVLEAQTRWTQFGIAGLGLLAGGLGLVFAWTNQRRVIGDIRG